MSYSNEDSRHRLFVTWTQHRPGVAELLNDDKLKEE